MIRFHFFLVHAAAVCSMVCVTAKILDWYNPYMDFSGHVSFFQAALYLASVLLVFTTGRRKNKNNKRQKAR
jgi:uncharacterized membrane protein